MLREEFRILMRLDRSYMAKNAELAKRNLPKSNDEFITAQDDPTLESRVEEQLDTSLFDSMF